MVEPVTKNKLELENSQLKSTNESSLRQGWLLLGIGLGVILTWGGTTFFSSPPTTQAEASVEIYATPQAITVSKVASSEIMRTLEASGTVTAFELVPVSARVTGLQVRTILAEEGQWVQAGQVIARLDDAVLQAQLLDKQAAVQKAQARLAELEAGTRTEELARAREAVRSTEAALIRAESDLALAQTRLERNRNLEAAGAIARDQLDELINEENNKRANLSQAQAQLKETQAQLAELEQGPRTEVILQAKAELAQAQAQLILVETQLQQTQVIAPVSGKIAERNARVGDLTATGTQLFQIIQGGRLQLELKVPETLIGSIQPGQTVKIQSNLTDGKNLLGTVREINPIIDEKSRQGSVEVDLPAEINLKPGMFLRAGIITETATVLSVPLNAVLPQSDGTGLVYVVKNDRVESQKVELGEILPSEKIEIKQGLELQQQVVTEGAAYLQEGDRVRVM